MAAEEEARAFSVRAEMKPGCAHEQVVETRSGVAGARGRLACVAERGGGWNRCDAHVAHLREQGV
jgi:hypothetical protein